MALCTDTRHKIPNTQCSEIFNRNTKEPRHCAPIHDIRSQILNRSEIFNRNMKVSRHCAPVRDIRSQILKWQQNIQSKHEGATALYTGTRHKIPNTQMAAKYSIETRRSRDIVHRYTT